MTEYISREGAIERIQPHVKPTSVYGEGYMQAIEHAVEILSLMPAADVQPVRRGRWTYPYKDKDINQCSECRCCVQDKISNVREMFAYCPFCGSRMKEG